jgi:hypothetical protein
MKAEKVEKRTFAYAMSFSPPKKKKIGFLILAAMFFVPSSLNCPELKIPIAPIRVSFTLSYASIPPQLNPAAATFLVSILPCDPVPAVVVYKTLS